MRSNHWKRVAAFGVLILLIGLCGCLPEDEAGPPPTEPVRVEILEIVPRDLPLVVEAVGRLAADRQATLTAEISGVIAAIHADMGDAVTAGQALIEVAPKDFELNLEEARAALKAAEAQLFAAERSHHRGAQLLPKGSISRDAYDQLEASFKAAKAAEARSRAALGLAEQQLAKTRITAPFDGYVAARLVEVGENVGQGAKIGQPLMVIVDLSRMKIRVYLAEKEFVQIDASDPVEVAVEALPGETFAARVDHVGVMADAATATFPVDVTLDNPTGRLKAGLTARARITARVIHDALLAPQSAVLFRGGENVVFVLDADGRAERRTVTLAESQGSFVRIGEGLRPGDRLVVNGAQYLQPGDRAVVAGNAAP